MEPNSGYEVRVSLPGTVSVWNMVRQWSGAGGFTCLLQLVAALPMPSSTPMPTLHFPQMQNPVRVRLWLEPSQSSGDGGTGQQRRLASGHSRKLLDAEKVMFSTGSQGRAALADGQVRRRNQSLALAGIGPLDRS